MKQVGVHNKQNPVEGESGRTRPADAVVRSWFVSLSNWNRWGPNDRLGTLNLISDDKRRAATSLVTIGRAVSCAWDVQMNNREEVSGELVGPQRWMAGTGLDTDAVPLTGPRTRDGSFSVASETISMSFHGWRMTHLDALSHVFWDGQMYGGVPAHNVTDRDGAIVHDVLSVADGIHGRGVLLDVAGARGVDALDPAEPIFPEHLDLAEEKAGVRVEEGDILFIRTGDAVRRKQGNWNPIANGQPGLDATCLPWLYERGVAVLGSDGPQEVRPSGYDSVYMPVHSIGIVAMGLWLIDNCDLEALAATCNEYGRWNYFVTVSALRLEGATGSPVNPIAIF